MKNWFFATYVSGLKDFVEKQITQDLDGCKISLSYDGLVLFNTTDSYKKVGALPYFSNVFISIEHRSWKVSDPVGYMKKLQSDQTVEKELKNVQVKRSLPYKVVVSQENSTIHVDRKELIRLEKVISDKTRLRRDVEKRKVEFWVLLRRENHAFFGLRILRKKKKLAKGELRPELAHSLVLLSEPSKDDVFLDPFSGSGALPLARAKYPYQEMIASDSSAHAVESTKAALVASAAEANVLQADARKLGELFKGLVDVIVTDPPWGLYQEMDNVEVFYAEMLREFDRLLKVGGRLVLLTAKKDEMSRVFNGQDGIAVVSEYDILVSGKKSRIFVCEKV